MNCPSNAKTILDGFCDRKIFSYIRQSGEIVKRIRNREGYQPTLKEQKTTSLDREWLGTQMYESKCNSIRAILDKDVRRKPLAFAADAYGD